MAFTRHSDLTDETISADDINELQIAIEALEAVSPVTAVSDTATINLTKSAGTLSADLKYDGAGFYDLLLEANQGGTNTNTTDFAGGNEVKPIDDVGFTLPTGTWSGIITYTTAMSRSVTTGGVIMFLRQEGASLGDVRLNYGVSQQAHLQRSIKVTGLAAGAHSVGMWGRGFTTAGTTYMFNCQITGHFWRTA